MPVFPFTPFKRITIHITLFIPIKYNTKMLVFRFRFANLSTKFIPFAINQIHLFNYNKKKKKKKTELNTTHTDSNIQVN